MNKLIVEKYESNDFFFLFVVVDKRNSAFCLYFTDDKNHLEQRGI